MMVRHMCAVFIYSRHFTAKVWIQFRPKHTNSTRHKSCGSGQIEGIRYKSSILFFLFFVKVEIGRFEIYYLFFEVMWMNILNSKNSFVVALLKKGYLRSTLTVAMTTGSAHTWNHHRCCRHRVAPGVGVRDGHPPLGDERLQLGIHATCLNWLDGSEKRTVSGKQEDTEEEREDFVESTSTVHSLCISIVVVGVVDNTPSPAPLWHPIYHHHSHIPRPRFQTYLEHLWRPFSTHATLPGFISLLISKKRT